jgi:hypothetical protein
MRPINRALISYSADDATGSLGAVQVPVLCMTRGVTLGVRGCHLWVDVADAGWR